MPKKIEISHRTIIFTVFFLIFIWLLFQIHQILIGLFVSLLIMTALNPIVDRLERRFFPRVLAILLLYALILGGIILVIASVIPPLVVQTGILANQVQDYLEKLSLLGIDPNLIISQLPNLGSLPAIILKLSVSFISNIVAFLALLVIAFYLLLERKNLKNHLIFLLGDDQEKKAEEFIAKAEHRLGGWVRGELVLMTIIGVTTYIGLTLLGIEFALPLALLAGILEIVPNIGPVLSAIPAIIAGLAVSPLMGLAVGAFYFLVQQLENTLIVPKVMQKAVGVNPLITLISLAIGFKLGGIVGATLAVPVFLLVQIIAAEVYASDRFKKI